MSVTITVDPSAVLGEVPRAIYGHFTEHLATIVYDGLWAEMLYGRKFEAPMVHRVRHAPATPWEPFAGLVEGAAFRRAAHALGRYASPHAGAHHSQSIELLDGHDGSERGLAQPEVRVEDGVTYAFRARLRKLGAIDTLRVAFRAADGVTELGSLVVPLPEIAQTRPGFLHDPERIWMDDLSWGEVTGVVTPARSDPDGWLSLTVEGGPGIVWLDRVSLMPSDHVDGFDPRVVEALRAIGVPVLKWPGGCMADDYDWRLGVGDRDGRYCSMDQAWASWDENDMGTDEFLRLCELVGAEPFLCVNAGSGSAELAAAWVGYCNGPAASRWGAERARNGHPEPYGVKHWCVGNEQWGWFERGYAGAKGYAERFLEFADAMRAADPAIELVAVGQPGAFDREVLSMAGHALDMLSIHHYTPEVEPSDREAATRKILTARAYADVFDEVRADIADAGVSGRVRVSFDEWGFCRPTHAGAMYAAWALIEHHRAAPLVALGGRSCAINVDGLITRDGTSVRREPVADVYQLFGQAHRDTACACEVTGSELVQASALVDEHGVSVFVVNAGAEQVEVRVEGLPTGSRDVETLADGKRDRSADLDALPAHSLAVLRA